MLYCLRQRTLHEFLRRSARLTSVKNPGGGGSKRKPRKQRAGLSALLIQINGLFTLAGHERSEKKKKKNSNRPERRARQTLPEDKNKINSGAKKWSAENSGLLIAPYFFAAVAQLFSSKEL